MFVNLTWYLTPCQETNLSLALSTMYRQDLPKRTLANKAALSIWESLTVLIPIYTILHCFRSANWLCLFNWNALIATPTYRYNILLLLLLLLLLLQLLSVSHFTDGDINCLSIPGSVHLSCFCHPHSYVPLSLLFCQSDPSWMIFEIFLSVLQNCCFGLEEGCSCLVL
jgi:hypothetical protein